MTFHFFEGPIFSLKVGPVSGFSGGGVRVFCYTAFSVTETIIKLFYSNEFQNVIDKFHMKSRYVDSALIHEYQT